MYIFHDFEERTKKGVGGRFERERARERERERGGKIERESCVCVCVSAVYCCKGLC